jgi:WD40 repeat protein
MRAVLGFILLAALPSSVVADDPPARWQVKHTVTLDQPATALAVGKTWAATGQADGTLRVLSLETGKEIAKFVPPGKPGAIRILTGTPEGKVLYGVEGNDSGFRWDWSKPDNPRYARRTFEGRVLDATPDGKRWAVFDGEAVKILEANLTADPFTPKVAIRSLLSGLVEEPLGERLKKAPSRVHGQFAPDDRGFLCRIDMHDPRDSEEIPAPLIRWDERGEISYTARPSPQAVAISPDGRYLAAVGRERPEVDRVVQHTGLYYRATHLLDDGFQRGAIRVEIRPFLPEKPEPKAEKPPPKNGEVACVVHPGGRMLVTGATDGKIRFWDTTAALNEAFVVRLRRWEAGLTDKPTDTLAGHTAAVRAIGFTPDGHTLVTIADDKRVLIWIPRPKP